MNATGITLSFQDFALIIAGMFTLCSLAVWYARTQAKSEYLQQCEKDRNDEQDIRHDRQEARMERHEKDMQEFRIITIESQKVSAALNHEVANATKQIAKLMQGMNNWWRDDPGKRHGRNDES